jgi:23S rRNA (cytidine1920-2'-O)/16S rRNA (cytidine1409-2'-O)-methyltransferase
MKKRLDVLLAEKKLVASRSQAESYIRLGKVKVDGVAAVKPGQLIQVDANVSIAAGEQYVSRAALKLESADEAFIIDWRNKTVLDIGSSTGGFTEYALKHGAKKVFAVDVGTNQLHPSLRQDPRISLHEKTDIRNFTTKDKIDIVVGDVSFISLRDILPHVAKIISRKTIIIVMAKPQFEAGVSNMKHKGVIKNDRMRRDILRDFELWSKQRFVIHDKADSKVAGSRGNVERFYLMSLV